MSNSADAGRLSSGLPSTIEDLRGFNVPWLHRGNSSADRECTCGLSTVNPGSRPGPTALSGALTRAPTETVGSGVSVYETADTQEDVVLPAPVGPASPAADRGRPSGPGDLGLLPVPGRGVRRRLLLRARRRAGSVPAAARAAVPAGGRGRRGAARTRPGARHCGGHPAPAPGASGGRRAAPPAGRRRGRGPRRVRAARLPVLGQRPGRRPAPGR